MRKVIGYLVAWLLALAPLSASAAILWAGGEDTSVVFIGTAGTFTSAGYNASYARAALGVSGNGTSTSDPPTNRIQTSTFTASSNIWIHASFTSPTGTATSTNNEQAVLIRSPDGVSRIIVRQTGTFGTLKVSSRNAAGTITDLATATLGDTTTNAVQSFDLNINYTCSGSGSIDLYLQAVHVLTFTGNPCTDSATTLNQVEFMQINNQSGNQGACAGGANPTCWSELIVANEDTRSMHLATLTLQGAGATQAWTPNTLANVNKAAISDTSFVATASNNQISEWTAPTSAPTGIWGVKTVILNARLSISTTGPQNAEFIAHVSGSDYTSLCTNPTLTTGFANYYCQIDNSPATGLVWGINEIFNTGGNQLGYGVESLM